MVYKDHSAAAEAYICLCGITCSTRRQH